MTRKRKSDSSDGDGAERGKRIKLSSTVRSQSTENRDEPENVHNDARNKGKGKEPASAAPDDDPQSVPSSTTRARNKLKPPRPFPTVPTSVSATGPRSAHHEGKNYICITRRTPLGAYMRRCKDLVIQDGYKSLHLSAMGAAIPHLVQLSLALPPILPFPSQDVHTEVFTGTVDVRDELIPDGVDEDISYQTRSKSTLRVEIRIGDKEDHGSGQVDGKRKDDASGKPKKGEGKRSRKVKKASGQPKQIVFQEPEQPDPDTT